MSQITVCKSNVDKELILDVGRCLSNEITKYWIREIVKLNSVVSEDVRVDGDLNEKRLPPKLPIVWGIVNGPLRKGVCSKVVFV